MQSDVEPAFGRWVKARRSARGLSQAQLAQAASKWGISLDASAVSRIETGDRSVRLGEADAIAAALGERLLSDPLHEVLDENAVVAQQVSEDAERVRDASWHVVSLIQQKDAADAALENAILRLAASLTKLGHVDPAESFRTAVALRDPVKWEAHVQQLFDQAIDRGRATHDARFLEVWDGLAADLAWGQSQADRDAEEDENGEH